MIKILFVIILIVAAAATFYLTVYEKEGPLEEFGRKVDDSIEKMQYGEESTMEKAGRKLKETTDELQEDMKK